MIFTHMKHFLFLIMVSLANITEAQTNNSKDWANFEKYARENDSLGKPRQAEKRVVFMGNSITEGWKIEDPSFFTTNNYIDRGISGQTSPQMLLRFRADVINLEPEVVVILAGINDIAENNGPISLRQSMENIKSMAELAEANKIKVILCSVLPANKFPWRPQILPADKVIALNTLIKNYCSEKQIPYVDYYSAMVDGEKGLDKQYSNDAVHPTLAGYKKMETILNPVLVSVLSK